MWAHAGNVNELRLQVNLRGRVFVSKGNYRSAGDLNYKLSAAQHQT